MLSNKFSLEELCVKFFTNWRLVCFSIGTCLAISGVYLVLAQPEYEGVAVIKVAQTVNLDLSYVDTESPALLIYRLKNDPSLDGGSICKRELNQSSNFSLDAAVAKAYGNGVVEIKVRAASRDLVFNCLNLVYKSISDYQSNLSYDYIRNLESDLNFYSKQLNDMKSVNSLSTPTSHLDLANYFLYRDEQLRLREEIFRHKKIINTISKHGATLIAPISVSKDSVKPQRNKILGLALIAGILATVIALLIRTFVRVK